MYLACSTSTPFLFRAATPQEIVCQGLMGKAAPIQLEIRETLEKGRGVFVQQEVPAGAFLLEYKTAEVFPRSQRKEKEEIYALNDEPCMILEVETPRGWYCLDATRRFNTLGRLLNHAPPHEATAKPSKPLFVKGKWRVGFLALKNLSPGQELTWDYGCPPQGQQWLMRRPRVGSKILSM